MPSDTADDPTTIGSESGRVALRHRREKRTDHVHEIPFDERVEVTCEDCGESTMVGIYGSTERSYDSCWTWECDAYHKFVRDRDAETDVEPEVTETEQTTLVTDGGHRPPCDAVAHMEPTPPAGEYYDLERRVCPNCRLYFDVGAESDTVFCSDACRQRHERGELIADGGTEDLPLPELEAGEPTTADVDQDDGETDQCPKEEVPAHGPGSDGATEEVVSPAYWRPVEVTPWSCTWEYTGWGSIGATHSIGETSETQDTLTIDGETVLRGDIKQRDIVETLVKWGEVKSRTEVE